MYQNKKVLLIGGGGSLGLYAAQELVSKGCFVDVLCMEDHTSDDPKLRFFNVNATLECLQSFMADKHYDGIINFLHYEDVENYKPVHRFLTANTSHLIFLSSYRVYADLQHPITEDAPRLLDVTEDKEFLEKETYALSKARAEDYIRSEKDITNWTIVRPVISTSFRRFDLVSISGSRLIRWTKEGQVIPLPDKAKDLIAAVDWSGNTGKLIANLLFKPDAFGEAFTISSCQDLTWGEVAGYYEELIGAKFNWMDTSEYIRVHTNSSNVWSLIYDRLYDRPIDNSKVLRVTGLTKEDFTPMKKGIQIELKKREDYHL